MLGNTYEGQDCAIARSLEVVGERWTLLVLRDALYGVRRFSDFADHLDIPRAVLADRLRKLVANGVLTRVTPDPDTASAHYELTDAGRALWPVIHSLARWGQEHGASARPHRTYAHADCEATLDVHGHCPVCGVAPEVDSVVTARPREERRTDRVSVALAQPHRMLDPI